MADGSVIIDTKLDKSGLSKGLGELAGHVASGVTAAIGAAGTALAGLGSYAVSVGSDFEAAMSNVAAISGATGAEIDALTEKAAEMGAKTKFSASESADAFSYMAMAGWKTEDMLSGIEGIMNLAAASGEDLALTSDIVTDALTAFGMTAADSGHFADILAAASSNANTNVSLMGETFKYVAPVAGSLGFAAEDTAVAIGLMANAGIKGSQAGTALRSVMTRLAKPTKESQTAMNALGISLTDSAGNVKDFNVLIGEMRESFSKCTDAEAAQYAAMLAGQEGMSGLLAIVNASEADYNKLTDAVAGCTDEQTGFSAAAEMAETQMNNLQGDVTKLKSATEGFGISLYDSVQAPLRDLAQTGTTLMGELTAAVKEGGIEGMCSALGDVLVQAIQKILEYVPMFVECAVNLAKSLISGLRENAGELATAAVDIGTQLLDGFISVGDQILMLGVDLITNLALGIADAMPEIVSSIGDAIYNIGELLVEFTPDLINAGMELISALGEAIGEQAPEIAQYAIGLWSVFITYLYGMVPELISCASEAIFAVVEALPGIIQPLIDVLPDVLSSIINAIVTGAPMLLEAVSEVVLAIVEMLPDFVQAITTLLPEFIQQIVDGLVVLAPALIEIASELILAVVEVLPDLIVTLLDMLPTIMETIVGGIAELLPMMIDCAMQFVMALVEALPDIINALILAIPSVIDGIIGALLELVPLIVDCGVQLLVSLVQALPDIIYAIVNVLPVLIAGIVSALIGLVPMLIKCGIELFTSLVKALPQIIMTIVAVLPSIVMSIVAALLDSLPLIIQCGIDLLVSLVEAMPDIITAIVAALPEIITSIIDALLSNVKMLVDAGVKLLTALITDLPKIIAELIKAAPEIIKALVEAFERCFDDIKNVGKNLLEGLWNGIQDMKEWLVGKIRGLGSAVMDAIKSVFGIASPSKVFRDVIGKNLILGLAEGIEDEADTAISAMEDIADDIASVTFSGGSCDYDGLLAEAKNAVAEVAVTTSEEQRIRAATNSSSYRDGDEETGSGDKGNVVEGDVYLDGKKVGRVMTPIIAKELDWEAK